MNKNYLIFIFALLFSCNNSIENFQNIKISNIIVVKNHYIFTNDLITGVRKDTLINTDSVARINAIVNKLNKCEKIKLIKMSLPSYEITLNKIDKLYLSNDRKTFKFKGTIYYMTDELIFISK